MLCLESLYDVEGFSFAFPLLISLLYLSNKNLLICLFFKFGNKASRNTAITVYNTKNKKYEILWGERGVYPINDSRYCINLLSNNLIIFEDDFYDLEGNYENINIDYDYSFVVEYGNHNIILKEMFDNNLYEADKNFN